MSSEIRKKSGLLVVFSGLDGAGKSTQIRALEDRARKDGREPVYLWTRGGYTPSFLAAKAVLRKFLRGRMVPPSGRSTKREWAFSNPFVRKLWLMIAILDLALVYGIRVRLWLLSGKFVICDRYLWDTAIDFRLNFPEEQVESWWIWRFLSFVTPAPDAAFLLLVPVAESVHRSDLKGEPFRDPPEILARRVEQYSALSRDRNWQALDGREPVSELSAKIWSQVSWLGAV